MKKIFLLILLLTNSNAFGFGSQPADETQPVAPVKVRSTDCYSDICVGDIVIDVDSNFMDAEVTRNNGGGYFDLTYSNGTAGREGTNYLATTQPGSCGKNFCIGDIVYDIDSQFAKAKIIGLRAGGQHYILQYLETLSGRGTDSEAYLAATKSNYCSRGICIGDLVYDTDSNPHEAEIVGIMPTNDSYIMRYTNGTLGGDRFSYIRVVKQGESAKKHFAELERQRLEREQMAREAAELEAKIQEGIADRDTYTAMRQSGLSHLEALEKASGPMFVSFNEVPKFLTKLSEFVYGFDRAYLTKLSATLASEADKEKANLFMINALVPYLRNSGYMAIKERFLLPSVARIQAANSQRGLQNLHSIESSTITRRVAVQMLAVSLVTSTPQLSDSQKIRAREILRILSTVAAGTMRVREMEPLFQSIPMLEALLLELAQNLYLQSRTATDMLLLEYLKNS